MSFVFQRPPFTVSLSFNAINMSLSSMVSESSLYKCGDGHAFEFTFRQPFTIPGIRRPCVRRVQSRFKINEVKGLLQERFDSHSIQIFSYSLEIVFRKNNRNGIGSNELELFNKSGAIRIRKMIFENHNMRRNFSSKIKGLTGC